MAGFTQNWRWFFDEIVPAFVKSTYAPRNRWKSGPFTENDARFFSEGILELSELFTLDRAALRHKNIDYFAHARFRSSYLLYLFTLQAAKFSHIFRRQAAAFRTTLECATKQGKQSGAIKIADLGAGPGTASLAWLMIALSDSRYESWLNQIDQIEFVWVDRNRQILKDGKELLRQFLERFPAHKHKVRVSTIAEELHSIDKIPGLLASHFSLILMGNTLNELHRIPKQMDRMLGLLSRLSSASGILMIEPASRETSQQLSKARDALVPSSGGIWGPCLHQGRCPLAAGRDWCHFSEPIEIPGQWFEYFSSCLGSPRDWLKFSWVWLASCEFPAPQPPRDLQLVVSDPIHVSPANAKVLICQPNFPFAKTISRHARVRRGDLIPKR